MLQRSITLTAILTLICAAGAAHAADASAGKAKVDTAACSQCHEVADWKGKSEADLQGLIKEVVGGKVKHPKKLQLSEADIANIAAYWSSAEK